MPTEHTSIWVIFKICSAGGDAKVSGELTMLCNSGVGAQLISGDAVMSEDHLHVWRYVI